jgi:hypothetical protein
VRELAATQLAAVARAAQALLPDIRGFEELPFEDLRCDLVTLKTAKAPGLNNPKSLLQRADQLIE